MFRLGLLRAALARAAADGVTVTDEAGAVERLGASPRLVEGRMDNIKITHPEDLGLAERLLLGRRPGAVGSRDARSSDALGG
jgi:2-C-methyl-D-erythritol 4-phosphate cytidylyltransferase